MSAKRVYHEGDEPVPGAGYRLVCFLGRGGFGEVWKATTPGGAEAAMKIIRLDGAEGRKEFRALQLVKRIRHPNLMPLVAFWLKSADGELLDDTPAGPTQLLGPDTSAETIKGTFVAAAVIQQQPPAELIIAMGLGDKSLFDRLKECRAKGQAGIPCDELLGYMEDAAEAIDFLNKPIHDQGSGPAAIQHCDIKPHNLMIVGGAVQVCDFGLARMMGVDRVTTGAASIAYAPPELLDSNSISPSTDQYSLAITYYELRTGKLPYHGESITAVLDAKNHDAYDFSACSSAEQDVLRRAAARDPGKRFPSAIGLVKALREAVAAGPENQPTELMPARRGSRLAVVAKGLVFVALAGALAYGAWQLYPAMFVPAVRERVVPEPDKVDSKPADVVPKPADVAPKATEIASTTQPAIPSTKPTPVAPSNMASSAARPPNGASPKAAPDKTCSLSPLALLDRGTQMLEKRQYDKAIEDLTEAAAQLPGNFRPLSRRGTAYFEKNEYQKAAEDFSAALKISPDATDYVNRGRCYWAIERLPEAIADFDAAIHSDPTGAAAFFFRGKCHLKAEKYNEAVSDFTEAIQRASDKPDPRFALSDAYEFRGSAYSLTDRGAEAIKDFTEALRLGPKDLVSIHGQRADAYELTNRPALAKADNQIAGLWKRLSDKPDDAAACRELAVLLATHPEADLRDGKKAVELAQRASKLNSEKNAADLDALAAAYAEAGRFDDAVTSAKKAIELAPNEEARKLYRTHLGTFEKKSPLRSGAER
jgi:tetratricopeptide (TPR) repeat protein